MSRQDDEVSMDVLRMTLQGMPQEPARGGHLALGGGDKNSAAGASTRPTPAAAAGRGGAPHAAGSQERLEAAMHDAAAFRNGLMQAASVMREASGEAPGQDRKRRRSHAGIPGSSATGSAALRSGGEEAPLTRTPTPGAQQHSSLLAASLDGLAGNEEVTPDMIAKVLMQIPEATERERKRRASMREGMAGPESLTQGPAGMTSVSSISAPNSQASSSGLSGTAQGGGASHSAFGGMGPGSMGGRSFFTPSMHAASQQQQQPSQQQQNNLFPARMQQQQQQPQQTQRQQVAQSQNQNQQTAASTLSLQSALPLFFNDRSAAGQQQSQPAALASQSVQPLQPFDLQQRLFSSAATVSQAPSQLMSQFRGANAATHPIFVNDSAGSSASISGSNASIPMGLADGYFSILEKRKKLLAEAEAMKEIPEELEANSMKPRTRRRYTMMNQRATRAVKYPQDQPFAKSLETDLVDCLQDGGAELDKLKTQKLIDATGLLQDTRQHILEPLTLYTRSELFELFASIAEVWKNSGKSAWKKRINKVKENARYRKAPRNGPTAKEAQEISELTGRIKQREAWEASMKARMSGKATVKRASVYQEVPQGPPKQAARKNRPQK